jgi:hypothetical protein
VSKPRVLITQTLGTILTLAWCTALSRSAARGHGPRPQWPAVHEPRQLRIGGPRRTLGWSTAMVGVAQHLHADRGLGGSPRRLIDVDLAAVADSLAERHPKRRYPAILLGSSNGALTHLAAATRCCGCLTPCWYRSRESATLTVQTTRWTSVGPWPTHWTGEVAARPRRSGGLAGPADRGAHRSTDSAQHVSRASTVQLSSLIGLLNSKGSQRAWLESHGTSPGTP